MEKSSGGWIGEIVIPQNISGVLVKFSQDEQTDNNTGTGYQIKLTDQTGKVLPDAEAGLAAAYSTWSNKAGFDKDRMKTIEILENVFFH